MMVQPTSSFSFSAIPESRVFFNLGDEEQLIGFVVSSSEDREDDEEESLDPPPKGDSEYGFRPPFCCGIRRRSVMICIDAL
jgi:hypothetical protein